MAQDYWNMNGHFMSLQGVEIVEANQSSFPWKNMGNNFQKPYFLGLIIPFSGDIR